MGTTAREGEEWGRKEAGRQEGKEGENRILIFLKKKHYSRNFREGRVSKQLGNSLKVLTDCFINTVKAKNTIGARFCNKNDCGLVWCGMICVFFPLSLFFLDTMVRMWLQKQKKNHPVGSVSAIH